MLTRCPFRRGSVQSCNRLFSIFQLNSLSPIQIYRSSVLCPLMSQTAIKRIRVETVNTARPIYKTSFRVLFNPIKHVFWDQPLSAYVVQLTLGSSLGCCKPGPSCIIPCLFHNNMSCKIWIKLTFLCLSHNNMTTKIIMEKTRKITATSCCTLQPTLVSQKRGHGEIHVAGSETGSAVWLISKFKLIF